MTWRALPLAVVLVAALAGCSQHAQPVSQPRPATSPSPSPSTAPASTTPAIEKQPVQVTVTCTNGLWCTNIGSGTCRFDDTYKPYPSRNLTLSGPDGTLLDSASLPLTGAVTGGADTHDYRCTATVAFSVPAATLYKVDAFGLRSTAGRSPLTVSIP